MRGLVAALALVSCLRAEDSGKRLAPSYSAASIVNSASNLPGALAPNAFATIYGSELAFSTQAIGSEDISGGALPTRLAGVQVLIGAGDGGQPAGLYFASPAQINFLVPASLLAGRWNVVVVREGTRGPSVEITLSETAPALFQSEGALAVATHADGSPVAPGAPAHAGELITLYAAGLGRTSPPQLDGRLAVTAAMLLRLSEFRLLLGGQQVEPARIGYAGITPGFAGLYQVNVQLPEQLDADPEIRIAVGDQMSPAGLKLRVE